MINIKKYLEYIFVFTAFSALNILNIFPSCKVYSNLDFDYQALLTWSYSSALGVIPYKQIFYPYGVLTFFNDEIILTQILYFLITPILLTILFGIFKKILIERIYAYLLAFLLYKFIGNAIGYDGFDRYGMFVILTLALGFVLYKKKNLTKILSFFLGIITGLIFWLMNDQGIYIFIEFSANLFFFPLVLTRQSIGENIKYYKSALLKYLIYIIGVIFGVIPLIYYLFKNEAVLDFFIFLARIKDLSLYAKTPFPPFSNTPENVFTFAILISSIFYLSFCFFFKKKITLNNYLQINLCFVVIFLEQKSLIRSIDNVITFPSFILLILLLHDFNAKIKIKKIYNFVFLILIVIASVYLFKNSTNNIKSIYNINVSQCINHNLSSLLNKNSEYLKVRNIIRNELKYNGKIFSYPSDPIFYILFKQTPPYYSNSYDSSPIYSQLKQINFIKNNNVRYIIYNLKKTSVMDDVPNYIRTSEEFSYIFNNFKVINNVKNFLILEKHNNIDIFADKNLSKYDSFKEYITKINLENIPRSEGKYKKSILFSNKLRVVNEFKTIVDLNNFLKGNIILSEDKFLVFVPEVSRKKYDEIVIISSASHEASIKFQSCDKLEFCIINLSKIPLFYKSRRIIEIKPKSHFSGKVIIFENLTSEGLW